MSRVLTFFATLRRALGANNRRVSNGEQVQRIAQLALTRKPSVDFFGYWQRHIKA